jgi:hypothetical protein
MTNTTNNVSIENAENVNFNNGTDTAKATENKRVRVKDFTVELPKVTSGNKADLLALGRVVCKRHDVEALHELDNAAIEEFHLYADSQSQFKVEGFVVEAIKTNKKGKYFTTLRNAFVKEFMPWLIETPKSGGDALLARLRKARVEGEVA